MSQSARASLMMSAELLANRMSDGINALAALLYMLGENLQESGGENLSLAEILRRLRLFEETLRELGSAGPVEASFQPSEEDLLRLVDVCSLVERWQREGTCPASLRVTAKGLFARVFSWR